MKDMQRCLNWVFNCIVMDLMIVKRCMLFFFFFSAVLTSHGQTSAERWGQLTKEFQAPPDTVQTSVYWYWISGNISKEGVIKDLEAMKKAGINRAFIGSNIVDGGAPTGQHKVFSDEW